MTAIRGADCCFCFAVDCRVSRVFTRWRLAEAAVGAAKKEEGLKEEGEEKQGRERGGAGEEALEE